MIGTEKKSRPDLKTRIVQTFQVQLNLTSGKYTAHVKYEQEKGNSKLLNIGIPDFIDPSGKRGLYAEFKLCEDINLHAANVKGRNDYFNNPGLEKMFKESIQPILKETLPSYMVKLMHFDE